MSQEAQPDQELCFECSVHLHHSLLLQGLANLPSLARCSAAGGGLQKPQDLIETLRKYDLGV